MSSLRLATIILASALLVAACGTTKTPEVKSTADGKAEGELTINGKTFPLKHVYAGRKKTADTEGPGGVEVLVTNEPVSDEILSKIFLELEVDTFRRDESKVLKDTSIKALYFEISEYALQSEVNAAPGFRSGILMTSDEFFTYDSLSEVKAEFQEFSFKDGNIRAKASNKWSQSEITRGPGNNLEITAEYSVIFEAKVPDQSLLARSFSANNKAWQESQSKIPAEGKAEGSMTVSKRPIALTHAYAMKEMLEDVTGAKFEAITVLLSEGPIRKEFLLLSFERGGIGEGQVLRLRFDNSGLVRDSLITYTSGLNGMFDETSAKSFIVENGRVKGSVENIETSSTIPEEKDRFSVSFDAPLN